MARREEARHGTDGPPHPQLSVLKILSLGTFWEYPPLMAVVSNVSKDDRRRMTNADARHVVVLLTCCRHATVTSSTFSQHVLDIRRRIGCRFGQMKSQRCVVSSLGRSRKNAQNLICGASVLGKRGFPARCWTNIGRQSSPWHSRTPPTIADSHTNTHIRRRPSHTTVRSLLGTSVQARLGARSTRWDHRVTTLSHSAV